MNSERLQGMIADKNGRAAGLASSDAPVEKIVEELYMAVYGRAPTAEELKITAGVYSASDATRQLATEDVLWALLNSAEFVFNH